MAVAVRTSNPTLRSDIFTSQPRAYGVETMSVQGTATKALILIAVAMATATYTWHELFVGHSEAITPLMMIGTIGGLIMALITTFKQSWAGVTAPLYAACEGLALGGISAIFEARFPGIAIQAVGVTASVFVGLLLAYKAGVIQATDRFKRGVFAVTAGIMVLYLVEFVLSFFHIHVPYIHDSGPIGIGVSAVIAVVAAMNLILDFDFIEQGARRGAPKYMEWYGAFGLMVTLVWLYLEILRLLAKLYQRD